MHKNKKYTISGYYAHNMHTISTQHAHTQHREHTHRIPDTDTTIQQNNMQHREHNTEHNRTTQPQHRCTDNLHKYSFDLYHEYVSIKNSNTIELYTILQDKV